MGTVKTTANTPSEGEETVGKVGSLLRRHTFFKSNIDTSLLVVVVVIITLLINGLILCD